MWITLGIKTFKYQQERKSNETSVVMVSETESAYDSYCKYIFIVKYCGIQYIYSIYYTMIQQIEYTKDGESPDYYFLTCKKRYIYIMV